MIRHLTYNIPKAAVIYFDNDKKYIFGVIAESRPGERLIEPKNIIGYDESYIDLDSTKLGTAFFYLVLFHCDNGKLSTVWKALIPSHGGFNNFSLHKLEYIMEHHTLKLIFTMHRVLGILITIIF